MKQPTALNKAIEIFTKSGGVLKTSQALTAGIHPVTLYRLRDEGQIEAVGRGLFRLKELPK
jgi:predicted transcriptional regulator of viral defense system